MHLYTYSNLKKKKNLGTFVKYIPELEVRKSYVVITGFVIIFYFTMNSLKIYLDIQTISHIYLMAPRRTRYI